MFALKKIVTIVFLLQILKESMGRIQIVRPPKFQGRTSSRYKIMQPVLPSNSYNFRPELERTKILDFHPTADFSKAKTQTFYTAALTPFQPPTYEFRYKIHDPEEKNYQEKAETRVGNTVRGYYSVREPNGYVRLVKYTSDENGFQTEVSHHHKGAGSGFFATTRYIA